MVARLTNWLSQFCSWHEKFKERKLGAERCCLPTCRRALTWARFWFWPSALRFAPTTAHARRFGWRARCRLNSICVLARCRSLTQDLSVSGLSALVGEAPAVGTLAPFRLKLGRDTQPVVGRCRVVANIPLRGSVRMAATFVELAQDGRSRIETLVYDAICAEIRVMLRAGQPEDLPASSSTATP
jgi:hypothetical protein